MVPRISVQKLFGTLSYTLFLGIIAIFVASPKSENATKKLEPTTSPTAEVQKAASVFSAPTPTPTPQKTKYQVTKVVDGDTIAVMIDGKPETIRLIGVNTPETVDPRTSVQCFGKEASAFTKNTLNGHEVVIEADATQGDRDKYGRLLRYVFLDDKNINQTIIAEGYGYEYTYSKPYQYQKDFKKSQQEASAAKRGLWSPETCSGTLKP